MGTSPGAGRLLNAGIGAARITSTMYSFLILRAQWGRTRESAGPRRIGEAETKCAQRFDLLAPRPDLIPRASAVGLTTWGPYAARARSRKNEAGSRAWVDGLVYDEPKQIGEGWASEAATGWAGFSVDGAHAGGVELFFRLLENDDPAGD